MDPFFNRDKSNRRDDAASVATSPPAGRRGEALGAVLSKKRGLTFHDRSFNSLAANRRAFLGKARARRCRGGAWTPLAARADESQSGQAEWRQSYETSDAHLGRRETTPGAFAGDGRGDRSRDPDLPGHRRARRLERGADQRRSQGRREVEGRAGLARSD